MCLEYNSTKTVPQPKNFCQLFVSPCLHCLPKIWQSDQPENFKKGRILMKKLEVMFACNNF